MSSLGLSEIARQVLRGEREYVASHAGRSQYSAGGMSACGLAALNCARIVLQREKNASAKVIDLVKTMIQRDICEVRPLFSTLTSSIANIAPPLWGILGCPEYLLAVVKFCSFGCGRNLQRTYICKDLESALVGVRDTWL